MGIFAGRGRIVTEGRGIVGGRYGFQLASEVRVTPLHKTVIPYAYLWDRETRDGQEEVRKDRPCVVALAVQRQDDGETWVTVLPVTHSPPRDAAEAVEIPPVVKRHLGLDEARSWVVVSEGDQFVWPGYDLRKARGGEHYDYGFLPPRFFASVLDAFRVWHKAHKVTLTSR